MLTQLMMWVATATFSQAPTETVWTTAIPAEADIVVHVRGVDAVRGDLVAMIKAMSPHLAATAEPALEQSVAQFKGQYGDQAAAHPFLVLMRVAKPENPDAPPFVVVVKAPDYHAVLKSVAGGQEPKLKREDGGFDSFDGPNGATYYAVKGEGTVAFGPDKTLIVALAKSGSKPASTIQKRVFRGDVGIYVNIGALAGRFAEQIDQAKKRLMAAIDQAGAQSPQTATMMEMVKGMYGGLFDSIKDAEALAINLDFAAEGLNLSGVFTVKADSKAAKTIAENRSGDAPDLAKLPADAAYFVYMNLDPKVFEQLQMMGLKMMSPGGKLSPELQASLDKLRGVGRIETLGATTIMNGMKTLSVTKTSDPKNLIAATEASMKAMTAGDNPLGFFKNVTVTPNAENHKGLTFTRIEMILDMDKLAKLQPGNPAAGASLVAMYGGDRLTSWYGVDATRMIQIIEPNWEKAKAKLDTYLDGSNGVGATAGYRSVRDKLPKQADFLMLMSVQGLVGQLAAQFSAMKNDPNLKPPADMPKEPAMIGFSLAAMPPTGFEFRLIVPSTVGPVVEKGLVPMFQGLQGKPNPNP